MRRLAYAATSCLLGSGCADDTMTSDGGPDPITSSAGDAPTGDDVDDTSEGNPTSAETSSGTTPTTTASVDSTSGSTSTGGPVEPFGPPMTIDLDLGFEPHAMNLADFDGDGALDLLITGTENFAVMGATLLGDGAGGFEPAVEAAIEACSAFPVVGHVDADDSADLFFGTCDEVAVFALADGQGGFATLDVLGGWSEPPVDSSSFVDFEQDGDDDLVVVTSSADLAVHLALSDGTLGPWPMTTDISMQPGASASRLATVDFGGIYEDRADIVLLGAEASVRFAYGLDPPGFSSLVGLDLSVVPSTMIAGDLDGGLDDLVVGSVGSSAVQVLLHGEFGLTPELPIALPGVQPLDLVLADERLVAIDVDEALLVVMAGDGAGDFEYAGTTDLPAPAVRVLAGDLDGDGRSDLVVATFAAGVVTVLHGQ